MYKPPPTSPPSITKHTRTEPTKSTKAPATQRLATNATGEDSVSPQTTAKIVRIPPNNLPTTLNPNLTNPPPTSRHPTRRPHQNLLLRPENALRLGTLSQRVVHRRHNRELFVRRRRHSVVHERVSLARAHVPLMLIRPLNADLRNRADLLICAGYRRTALGVSMVVSHAATVVPPLMRRVFREINRTPGGLID